MKRTRLVTGSVILFITLFASSVLFVAFGNGTIIEPRVQASEDDSSSSPIEGAWRVVVAAPGTPPQYLRETYARGGGFVNSSSLDVLPDGAGPGIGTWAKTGRRQFTATYEKFTQTGVLKITQVVRVNGDTYNGTASLAFCDGAGENCSPSVVCVGIAGKRMDTEALSCP